MMMKTLPLYILLAISFIFNAMAQKQDPNLQVVASFGKSQPIGVSVSSDNRVFVSFPHKDPYLFGLTEIVNGERKAFPNAEWNAVEGDYKEHFVNVQDIYVDTDDQLWVLDSKPAPSGSIFGKEGGSDKKEGQFKLVQIDLKSNQVKQVFTFEDLDKSKSGLNDVRVDTDKKLAYLSDPGQASVIVLDLQTGKSRKLLSNSSFTLAKPDVVLAYHGKEMRDKDGNPFRSNVNGIALTKDNKWFYFKPINAMNLYRIETKYLADANLTDEALKSKVEDMGEVGITHGLVADQEGNIYLTTSLDYSIRRLTPEGKLEIVVQDPRLLWPDSLGVGSDGYLYFSCAQMQLLPQWNGGKDLVQYPYEVYRVKVL
ncbi:MULTISPECIES: major royal jelly family protein [unclassified Sphingobacterium]|uniref:major royal jelly family protein n=1 Tax=unclassified Sphingobacterium TaxID=2609468 RepID=UPI0020C2E69B|nr:MULTISPECIES: major royal jelly family protein [unclassified Sphingobacterium]